MWSCRCCTGNRRWSQLSLWGNPVYLQKIQKLCFPWRSQAAGDSPFAPCFTSLSASALLEMLLLPWLFSESHFWTNLAMQDLPRQHREGHNTAARFWWALVMHFLNWLVTELKKKIQQKRPELSCFPDKSHHVQLRSHGPVRAAWLASGPASAKEGSGKLHGKKGPFTCRGGIALTTASFFSQNISGLFPRRRPALCQGPSCLLPFLGLRAKWTFKASWEGDKCIFMTKEKSAWGEQLAVSISCFLPKSDPHFPPCDQRSSRFQMLSSPGYQKSTAPCGTSAPLAAHEQSGLCRHRVSYVSRLLSSSEHPILPDWL